MSDQEIDTPLPCAVGTVDVDAVGELNRLETLLKNTPDPYGQLSARLADLRIIVSGSRAVDPRKRLPSELLAEIFCCCCPLPNATAIPPKTTDIPMVLTRVSRGWRELALQLSELWASINVSFEQEGVDVQRVARISGQWLSRTASTYPLSITAACSVAYANAVREKPDLLAGFMTVVLSHALRLKHLVLTFPSLTMRPLFSLPGGSFPLLETIELHPQLFENEVEPRANEYCDWHWPGACAAFDTAPSLREVSFLPVMQVADTELGELLGQHDMGQILGNVDETAPIWSAPTVSLPWSQLRAVGFILTACPPDVWCSVLAQCPQIERCELGVRPGTPPVTLGHIRLVRLEFLYLFGWAGASDQLLDCIVAPKLRNLAFCGEIVSSTIANFRLRSLFTLEICYLAVHIAHHDVEILFQNLSDITFLIIPFFSTEHFPAIVWDRIGRAEFLPQLRRLIIQPRPSQMTMLVDMIRTRWEAAATTGQTSLKVMFSDVTNEHRPAVNEGLKPLEQFGGTGNQVEFISLTS
ncbi:hypothetical protein B0H11DRAFT_2215707 [Mycena galericulata]|nr:hypothetical protein B0H11DRAFT_2215707 [Mycena galericulata]